MLLGPFWRRCLLVGRVLGIALVCAPTLRLGLRLQDEWLGRWYVDEGGMAVGMEWEWRKSGQVLLSSTGISSSSISDDSRV
jgi:hypothetical protein